MYIQVVVVRDNRPSRTTVPVGTALDRPPKGAYAYKHACQGVSLALRLREHASGHAGDHAALRRGASPLRAPDHPVHVAPGPGTNRRAGDPGCAQRLLGARQHDLEPDVETVAAIEVDSTPRGRGWQGTPRRARSRGAADVGACNARMDPGTAAAQGGSRRTGLGR